MFIDILRRGKTFLKQLDLIRLAVSNQNSNRVTMISFWS